VAPQAPSYAEITSALSEAFKQQKATAALLQARNRELTEAHEQQTATAEILRVISSSPTELQPVFDAIVTSAVRLCDGLFSALFQFDGELIHQVAHHNFTPEALEAQHRVFPAPPGRGSGAARAILDRAVVHIRDVELDPEYRHQAVARAIGWRSGLFVPMLRGGAPIGAIMVTRVEPGPFSDSETNLLKTFAAHAVIAIENVRLFNESKEALEQQTATSEILRVIASSPTDLQPVMDAVAENAARVCGANDALILRVEGDALRVIVHYGSVPTSRRIGERIPLTRGTMYGRTVVERQAMHRDDDGSPWGGAPPLNSRSNCLVLVDRFRDAKG
jgi:two-component system NtrC family sensor kinase